MSHYVWDDASPISEYDLMFYGPEGAMTLEEAAARGYDIRRYSHQGMMVTPIGYGFNVYELANQGRMSATDLGAEREMNERAAQMQNAAMKDRMDAALAQMSQTRQPLTGEQWIQTVTGEKAGGLEAGAAEHMGVPYDLSEGLIYRLLERVRQWRRR